MFEVMHKCSLTGQLCPSTHKDAGTQPCNLCPVTFPERKEPNAGVKACLSPDGMPNHCVLWKCHEAKTCARGVAVCAPAEPKGGA